MSRVLEVPSRLDETGFESMVERLNRVAPEPERTAGAESGTGKGRVLLDARRVRWASPYGLVGLLAVGQVARDRTGLAPAIESPESSEVKSYWERMDFWKCAAGVFQIPTISTRSHRESDALLEITPIRSHHDVHEVVERVRERAASILSSRLRYPRSAVIQFSVILSEVCQNILEHAEADGWVCAQTYRWEERLGRDVAVLAVMDVGVGFEGSLAAEHARRFGDEWSAAAALEAAFLQGESRFRDPGRGQGLQAIRRQVEQWEGEVRIRSGDAMIARVPEWDDIPERTEGLPGFPGAQIFIVLPAREEEVVPA